MVLGVWIPILVYWRNCDFVSSSALADMTCAALAWGAVRPGPGHWNSYIAGAVRTGVALIGYCYSRPRQATFVSSS